MASYVVVSQTISRRWLIPKGKTPGAYLAEVLKYGFDEKPAHEETLSEEYFLMAETDSCNLRNCSCHRISPLEPEE